MGTNAKVVSLQDYRKEQKRLFMEKNEVRLEKFLQSFVKRNFKVSYSLITEQYLAVKYHNNELAWDYQDFRDSLIDAIAELFGPQLWKELQALFWFDPQWLSQEEVVDRCIRHYILSETLVANS